MKLELKLTNDWLEATWYIEENEVKTQVHCESFSGHPEHIAMLRDRAVEFGTDLSEFETLIKQAEDLFVHPTQEELDKELTDQKIQEAKAYLASTDYVVTKIAEAQALGEDPNGLLAEYAEVLAKRKEYRAYLGANS